MAKLDTFQPSLVLFLLLRNESFRQNPKGIEDAAEIHLISNSGLNAGPNRLRYNSAIIFWLF